MRAHQYDQDKSGAIDFSEFFCMIMQLLEESRKVLVPAMIHHACDSQGIGAVGLIFDGMAPSPYWKSHS